MMAAVVGLGRRTLLTAKASVNLQQAPLSFKSASKAKKAAYGLLGAITVGGLGAVGVALATPVFAKELSISAPAQHWSHHGLFATLDMASVRRGWEVYKQVCAACHSLKYVAYREFVGAFMTEEEAKNEAKAANIRDGPNDEGEYYERPGKLSDRLPRPYLNDQAAMAANNGALPPDLTYIVKARLGGEDYVFSLLTGYCDPPAGMQMPEDTHYNPYFYGGAISMAEALYTDIIEYSDGTPATKSQLAKDVVTFLLWASEPEHDERKKIGIKCLCVFTAFTALFYYYKRHVHSITKARKFAFKRRDQ